MLKCRGASVLHRQPSPLRACARGCSAEIRLSVFESTVKHEDNVIIQKTLY